MGGGGGGVVALEAMFFLAVIFDYDRKHTKHKVFIIAFIVLMIKTFYRVYHYVNRQLMSE